MSIWVFDTVVLAEETYVISDTHQKLRTRLIYGVYKDFLLNGGTAQRLHETVVYETYRDFLFNDYPTHSGFKGWAHQTSAPDYEEYISPSSPSFPNPYIIKKDEIEYLSEAQQLELSRLLLSCDISNQLVLNVIKDINHYGYYTPIVLPATNDPIIYRDFLIELRKFCSNIREDPEYMRHLIYDIKIQELKFYFISKISSAEGIINFFHSNKYGRFVDDIMEKVFRNNNPF